MIDSFEALPEDRKKRIMDVGILEFAENGYEKASTNSITKKAGISKGILFHYFGSKKKLYLYMLDYLIDESIKKFYTINEKPSADVFERLMERSKIKIRMAYEDPVLYKFLMGAVLNTPYELMDEIQERIVKLTAEHTPIAFRDIDTSKFRKGLNPTKVIELITLSLEGLFGKYMSLYKSRGWSTLVMEDVMKEAAEYIEILKKGVYEDC